jgi:hypothetical protein
LNPDAAAPAGLGTALAFILRGAGGQKGETMTPFARFAFFTVARDAGFVTLAAMILMLAFSFEPAWSFEIGASVALLFSIGLLARVYFLTEERLERSEVWRALPEEHRPPGTEGRRWARSHFELLLLYFAKGASGFAGLLYVSALIFAMAEGLAQAGPSSHHFVNAAAAQTALK